jgi:hypothetical protein
MSDDNISLTTALHGLALMPGSTLFAMLAIGFALVALASIMLAVGLHAMNTRSER